ncbi:hypothetical protein WMF26_27435 [Sorangium sp. So ce185]|uniref:hypothetical protein n=1 Tax=Sorangium sp. So ce185 TaxID=3133287 RepID=UPI003F5FB7B4
MIAAHADEVAPPGLALDDTLPDGLELDNAVISWSAHGEAGMSLTCADAHLAQVVRPRLDASEVEILGMEKQTCLTMSSADGRTQLGGQKVFHAIRHRPKKRCYNNNLRTHREMPPSLHNLACADRGTRRNAATWWRAGRNESAETGRDLGPPPALNEPHHAGRRAAILRAAG